LGWDFLLYCDPSHPDAFQVLFIPIYQVICPENVLLFKIHFLTLEFKQDFILRSDRIQTQIALLDHELLCNFRQDNASFAAQAEYQVNRIGIVQFAFCHPNHP
jgi:hypothetical protein